MVDNYGEELLVQALFFRVHLDELNGAKERI
jgi:hypothetical protein